MSWHSMDDLRDLLGRLDQAGVQCVSALIACADQGWTADAQDYAAGVLEALERARRRRAVDETFGKLQRGWR